jgi:transposase
MSDLTPIPEPLWDTVPPEAQAALRALLTTLERRIAELEERVHKHSTSSSKPPSSDPPSVKRRPPAPASGKKAGGPPGHRHHPRASVPPEQLRQVIACKPPECRRGGHEVHGDDPEPSRHQVAAGPPLRPVGDEYRLHRLECPRCHRAPCAALPPGVPAGAFGHRLRALLSGFAGADRLGKRPIRRSAFALYGRSISTGRICRSERHGALELAAPVEPLREPVRRAASAHIDETSWKQGRDQMWPRVAVTKLVTVFTSAPTRGAEVAKAMLGCAARKVVISDRPKSYAWIQRRQFCWAPHRGDFQAMIDRGGDAGEVGQRLMEHSDARFGWWHRARDGTLGRSGFQTYVAPMRPLMREDRERGAAWGCPRTVATCRGLLTGETPLRTLVRVEGVEATNSGAERASRHGVIYRELSGGPASESGRRFVERRLAVVASCRPQDINVLDYLTRCDQASLDGQTAPSLLPSAASTQAA